MNRVRLVVLAVLVVGGGALLVVLQQRGAETPVSPDAALGALGRAQRSAERVPLTLTRIGDEEEQRVGDTLFAQLIRAGSTDDGRARIAAYIDQVGQRVAAHAERQTFPYRFHLHGEAVNAFALPGGHVVVGMGLVRLVESEDELAAVLGHEVAHIDRRHCIERLQYELAARRIGVGAIYQLGDPFVDLFRAGYSTEYELEADRIGLELAVAAGYSPEGGPAAMERLAALRPAVERQGAATPVGELTDVAREALQGYFRSHPPEATRVTAMRDLATREGWPAGQPLRPFEPAVRAVLVVDDATSLLEDRRLTEAITRFREATALDGAYQPAWRGFAEALWLDGASVETRAAALRALALDQTDDDVWLWLADSAAAGTGGVGRRGTASPGRGRGGQVGPPFALPGADEATRRRLAVVSLGLVLARGDQTLADVPEAYGSIVAAEPDGTAQARLRWLMGHLLYRLGHAQWAATELEKARQQWLDQPLVAVDYAGALSDNGRQADALTALRAIGSLGRAERARAEVIRAVVSERTGQPGDADAAFRRAVDIDPLVLRASWSALHASPNARPVVQELQQRHAARR